MIYRAVNNQLELQATALHQKANVSQWCILIGFVCPERVTFNWFHFVPAPKLIHNFFANLCYFEEDGYGSKRYGEDDILRLIREVEVLQQWDGCC